MMSRFKSMALGMAALMTAVTGVAAGVIIDYDHDAHFEEYKTFAFVFAEGQANLAATAPPVHQRVLLDIKKHLVLHGLTEVEVDPDVGFTYHYASQDETVLDTAGCGYGYGPGWGPGWGHTDGGWGNRSTQVMTFTKGTIIIDAYDTETKLAIWRGVMTKTLPESVEKARKRIDRDVNKMFEKWAKHSEDPLEAQGKKD
jgi:hypothetical protein